MSKASETPVVDAVVNLAMAQAAFQKACDDFAKCRCYSYYTMVQVTSKRLLEASDAMAEMERNVRS